MKRPSTSPAGAIFLSICCTVASAAEPPRADPEGPGLLARSWASVTDGAAWQGAGHWRLALAPYAPHFRYSAEHRYVWALGVERQRPDNWLAGFSYFRNSFGQPSAYAYVGYRSTELFGIEPLYFQWSAGVLYGYRGQFKNKVALNVNGFAPGALVGLGWQFNKQSAVTLHMLGDAALMVQLSHDFR